ncbi:MAG TPA: bi-domain-containing oxidoreductase [Acidimicrobiia bacterium]|nr:bi-domain-containing oxidoreductase [Acidimicrobiia bacterium]
MRQVSIQYRSGDVRLRDVPEPAVPLGGVTVRTRVSLISSGTERAAQQTGERSLVAKARSRPDLVAQVMKAVKRDGLRATATAAFDRLNEWAPLGYSLVGDVDRVGAYGGPFRPGDRVAAAGAGHANHAEMVSVPANLVARVPPEVSDDAAAYTTVGAIALQGLRQADSRFGDVVVVIGLGLVGQLTAQLAKAAGCLVIGTDLDEGKVDMAARTARIEGSSDVAEIERLVHAMSGGHGADAALITASTPSSDPVALGARLLRDRGRVVAVGDVGLDLDRRTFYDKEIDLRLSRSYGPGRYDVVYEELGVDYPIGYVRWTERRNMEAFLAACAAGSIDPTALTTQRFSIGDAEAAYALIGDPGDALLAGVLLDYPPREPGDAPIEVRSSRGRASGDLRVGFLGAGNFAARTLMPAFEAADGVSVSSVASEKGLSAGYRADRDGAVDPAGVEATLADAGIDTVAIATRHDSHASLVSAALDAGKHVFVEKPLCRVAAEVDGIIEGFNAAETAVMVGFNRRHAPATNALLAVLPASLGPASISIRVNAGPIGESWLADPEVGGGALVGEACHFLDLATHLAQSEPVRVRANGVPVPGKSPAAWTSFTVQVEYADGSVASVVYSDLGEPRFAKERVEVLRGGCVGVIDDFRAWEVWKGGKKAVSEKVSTADKGHRAEVEEFVRLCRGASDRSAAFARDLASTLLTFAALDSLLVGGPVDVPSVSVAEG